MLDVDSNGLCDCEDGTELSCVNQVSSLCPGGTPQTCACLDMNGDNVCDCMDQDSNGVCDPGLDCVDQDGDALCDCPDRDGDGLCDYEDRDGDGLRDCEEVFFGTAQNGNDTDADGLPDLMEVRFRTNPTVADDEEDADFDRTLNGVEVRVGTDPLCNDATLRSRSAYRYTVDELGLVGARTCYTYNISNITVVPTLARPDGDPGYPGNGWNRILVYAGEVAFDDASAFPAYRVACVMVGYNPERGLKNPPSGRIRLREDNFVEVSDFDPDIHCIMP